LKIHLHKKQESTWK